MSFNQGDRVRYTGKSRIYSDKAVVGATGTVQYYNSREDVNVEWDTDGKRPGRHVFAANLELVKPEFKAGDRVRGNNFRNPVRDDGWREGVVESVGTLTTTLHTESGSYLGVVWTETLEAAPGFKVGDRIAAQRGNGEVITGEIVAVHPDRHTRDDEYLVRDEARPDLELYVRKNTAVAAPKPAEPVKPAAGSKVRVTYEGIVSHDDNLRRGFHVTTDDGHKVFLGKAAHTLEVLAEPEPEPYAEGTLVQLPGDKIVRTSAKRHAWVWTNTGQQSILTDDAYVRGQVAKGKAEILYDPAAQS
jgi:hypothetical protein